jgi:hypothetical protein
MKFFKILLEKIEYKYADKYTYECNKIGDLNDENRFWWIVMALGLLLIGSWLYLTKQS